MHEKNFIENRVINFKLTNAQDVLNPYCGLLYVCHVYWMNSTYLPTYRSASKGK